MKPEHGKSRRFLVLVLVGTVHLVLLLLCSRTQQWPLRNLATQSLILLDLSSSVAEPTPKQVDAATVDRARKMKANSIKDVPDNRPDRDGVSSLSSLPAGRSAPIDWNTEAEHTSQSHAASIFKQLQQACKEAALKGEKPPECRTYRTPDAWVPEPKKFDISGGLPFMRLGNRCVIGLGFFGCGVGKLPEANSHVLDDMREPDRPRSSVPSPDQ
jgi:hypothetical protein